MTTSNPRIDKLDSLLGARVKALRKERGVSQSALAGQLGITFQQVQKYENGSNRISAVALVKLADALGVQPMDLLGEVEPAGAQVSDAEKLLAAFERIRSADVRASVLRIVTALAGR